MNHDQQAAKAATPAQYAIRNTQYAIRNTQYAIRNTQYAIRNTKMYEQLKWNEAGLIPAILQDAENGTVLMMAWMNQESLRLTQERGEAVFWSRSRQEIWHKGATSGNVMRVHSICYDCDGDTLLLQVFPNGAACHTGAYSCFFNTWPPNL